VFRIGLTPHFIDTLRGGSIRLIGAVTALQILRLVSAVLDRGLAMRRKALRFSALRELEAHSTSTEAQARTSSCASSA
jgi:hypothetical protein